MFWSLVTGSVSSTGHSPVPYMALLLLGTLVSSHPYPAASSPPVFMSLPPSLYGLFHHLCQIYCVFIIAVQYISVNKVVGCGRSASVSPNQSFSPESSSQQLAECHLIVACAENSGHLQRRISVTWPKQKREQDLSSITT